MSDDHAREDARARGQTPQVVRLGAEGSGVPVPLPVDRLAHLRLRRRARLTTALAPVPAVWFALQVYGAARSDEPEVHARGAWWFVHLALYLLVAVWVVARAWRRSHGARPHTQRLEDLGAARPSGRARGVPELDAASGPHRGLSGEVQPPRRW